MYRRSSKGSALGPGSQYLRRKSHLNHLHTAHKTGQNIQELLRGHGPLPIFDLVGPFHVVDVHADLVVDVGRQICAVAEHDVGKHYTRPELLVVKETHGLVDQSFLVGHRLQLVQVHTLGKQRQTERVYGGSGVF